MEVIKNIRTLREEIKKFEKNFIFPNSAEYRKILDYWTLFISERARVGLVPLFIVGSGASLSAGVPSMKSIIEKLNTYYKEAKENDPKIKELFGDKIENVLSDRTKVARLLNEFQETSEEKRDVWKKMTKWLLGEIVNANPNNFHKCLSKLYGKVDAISLTVNFDGLLIRNFLENKTNGQNEWIRKRIFSLTNEEECEKFFLRNEPNEKDVFAEIQLRGDILYVRCASPKFCINKKNDAQHTLWANITSIFEKKEFYEQGNIKQVQNLQDELLRCPYCSDEGVAFLSFPGSFKKEQDMKGMLQIVWRYLAFRVSCVTVVGLSGDWDPLIVAFLGDLLSERDIPMIVVDPLNNKDKKFPNTLIIKELVKPKLHLSFALMESADNFANDLNEYIEQLKPKISSTISSENHLELNGIQDDFFWYSEPTLKKSLNYFKVSRFESELINFLEKSIKLKDFAQIGLKSYWLDLHKYKRNGDDGNEENRKRNKHNRFNHSIGVMAIASYLYDKLKKEPSPNDKYERQFLRIAALLHDVGHLPFSHLIEDVFNELNWQPVRYKKEYSHVIYTEKNVYKIFENNNSICNTENSLKKKLNEIGYETEDVINLINGCFGVPYLDALINSSIDADKIDYVFRDSYSTTQKIPLSPKSFLDDIVNGISITPEKFLAFSGLSAMASRDLIQTRLFLYKSLYLRPGILILEGIAKIIIKTYFIHELNLDGIKKDNKVIESDSKYSDLGGYKISFCINRLLELSKIITIQNNSENIEFQILKTMYNKLLDNEDLFNKNFFKNLKKSFDALENIKGLDNLKKFEGRIIYRKFTGNKSEIEAIAKKVSLNFPGAAIIEVSKLPGALSIAKSRRDKERSDCTNEPSECILVPDGKHELWNATLKAQKPLFFSSLKDIRNDYIYIYFYPMSSPIFNNNALSFEKPDADFAQCINLFDKLVKEKNSVFEIK